MTTHITCAKCEYWQRTASTYGECRCHAPQRRGWAETHEEDWCGDGQKRVEKADGYSMTMTQDLGGDA